MTSIRTLLVDDEPIALRGLQQLLQADDDIEIVGQCADGAAAISSIAELQPDLVFLDIQMPELSGFDVIEAIGLVTMPMVIFVTAYDAYAIRAFDVHALDYVLKPVDPQRLQQALKHARKQNQIRQVQRQQEGEASNGVAKVANGMPAMLREQMQHVLQELGLTQPQRWRKRLAIKYNGRVILINIHDVDRIEAAGNYVEINVCRPEGGKTYLLRESLSSLEQSLDPQQFTRISRSSIVNINSVLELQNMFNGDFVAVLKGGGKVNGSRRYREALNALLH
jgi:two-component system LytT family response regulator